MSHLCPLRYSRPYTPHLIFSVVLMACVGAAQALTALLIGPIFDRVLNPASAEMPVTLLTIPIIKKPILLNELLPASIHNVWTMVAVAILAVDQGAVRLLGKLSDQLRGSFGGYRLAVQWYSIASCNRTRSFSNRIPRRV